MSFICDSGKLIQVRRDVDLGGLVARIATANEIHTDGAHELTVSYLLKIHGASAAIYDQWVTNLGNNVVFYGHLDTEEDPQPTGMIVHALAVALAPESWLEQH